MSRRPMLTARDSIIVAESRGFRHEHREYRMSKSPLEPNVLERALSKVLNQEFDALGKDWTTQCKAALERVLEAPELLVRLAEEIETIERPEKNDGTSLALPSNLILQEVPVSGSVDAISDGWPTGSFPEDPESMTEPQGVGSLPILPRDLESSFPVWLRRLLAVNLGRVLAVDLRLPTALATAGDGWELPAVSIGERDSIRVNISSKEMTINPIRMTSTEPLWLSVAVIRDGNLLVLGQWQFEQTVEVYPWANSFDSGV